MKFKDKDGNVFEDIKAARSRFCKKVSLYDSKVCTECPISVENNGSGYFCSSFCEVYPAEAARLMGYDVVEEEDAELNAHRELLDAMYDKNRKSSIEFSVSLQKEANMEKQKLRNKISAQDWIRESLGQEELLCQLAEEAAELSQAALKLRRACGKTNPTPLTEEEAYGALLEEIADVSLCLLVLGVDTGRNRMRLEGIMDCKAARWAARLEEVDGL